MESECFTGRESLIKLGTTWDVEDAILRSTGISIGRFNSEVSEPGDFTRGLALEPNLKTWAIRFAIKFSEVIPRDFRGCSGRPKN